jgi:hypothetical protein
MKRYVPIIIGVVALCAVLYVGTSMRGDKDVTADETNTETLSSSTNEFTGQVVRVFEGENVLNYSMGLPEGATTTIGMDGALVNVIGQEGSPLLEMYMSYEGARGYSADDYITNKIAATVPDLTHVGTSTIGLYEWTVVESERSVWHVAKAGNGNWLLVVENLKADADKADAIIESISTK